jgi:hypothetical protein
MNIIFNYLLPSPACFPGLGMPLAISQNKQPKKEEKVKKTMISVVIIALVATAGLAMAQGWGRGSGSGMGFGPNMNGYGPNMSGYGPGFERPFGPGQAMNNLTPEERAQWQAPRGNFRNFGWGSAMNQGGFGRGGGMGAGFRACPRW